MISENEADATMPNMEEHVPELPDCEGVLEEAEQVLKECFSQHKQDEIFVSFNGGKDCTVLLDITIRFLKDMYQSNDIQKQLKVVYIRNNSNSFKELEDFAKEVEGHYGIQLKVMEGDMKMTLERILEEDRKLKCCLMGTRRTDPYSNDLDFMQLTDRNWPQIIRVLPLLNWSYHHIWSYIYTRKVPYCTLYDQGYTSIGSTHNTGPNPSLAYTARCGCVAYRPAWRLRDAGLERAGRGPHAASDPQRGRGLPPPAGGHAAADPDRVGAQSALTDWLSGLNGVLQDVFGPFIQKRPNAPPAAEATLTASVNS